MKLFKGTKVVVFTSHRSIYFGELAEDYDCAQDFLVLHNARHGYSLATTKGTWQVTTDGPGPSAKVGPPVPTQIVRAVANVALPTQKAVNAWDKSTWAP